MNLSWLKTVVNSQVIVLSLLLSGLTVTPCFTSETITPARNISVVQEKPETPDWKIMWDKARRFAHDGDYVLSAFAYSKLFGIKPNIEEANWEYCKVLLQVEDYQTVAKIIDGLLEKNPNRSEYLMAGAAVAFIKKDYAAASHYYARVFEMDPVGENSDTALERLALSLRKQGKKELSFTLLEQLSSRQPDSHSIIHKLALDARELGKNEKARILYSRLMKNPAVEDRVVFQAAQVFDEPGYEDEASLLWQEYLNRHPDYMPFRKKLADYYITKGAYDTALEHLNYLADRFEDNQDFLLMAGNVCLNKLNRPDKALVYYERYSNKFPEDQKIKKKIVAIQSGLANDFLSIVENGGASLLWNDLAEIAPNRLAIYFEMAELLEKEGKVIELLEVLTIIYKQSPGNDDLALRIANQYIRIKQYKLALNLLDHISDRNRKKPYYLLKGNIEVRLGMELEGLTSYDQGLVIDPDDLRLRWLCLELAGKTGLAKKQITLFNSGIRLHKENFPYDFVLTHLDLLAFNSLFVEYEKTSKWARDQFIGSPETVARLEIHRAETLRKSGNTRKAEKLLRSLLNDGVLSEDVLFKLAENSVADKDLGAAEIWSQPLRQITAGEGNGLSFERHAARLMLLNVKMLGAEGEYESALATIEEYFEVLDQKLISKEMEPLLFQITRERCWLNLYNENLKGALELTRAALVQTPFDPELLTLHRIIDRRMNQKGTDDTLDSAIKIGGKPVLTRLLPVVRSELLFQEYSSAAKHSKMVLDGNPDSVVGNTLFAELLVAQGKLDEAVKVLDQLIDKFPGESYFYNELIEIESRRGRYQNGIALLRKKVAGSGDVEELVASIESAGDYYTLLTLARLLWGHKQYEGSLDIYKRVLSPSVLDILSERFKQNQINYLYLTREDTFWNSMMVRLQSKPGIIGELMEPPFLIENRGNEAGKIVTEYFEKYSWQKLINSEYLAKNAIYQRNYYYAEHSYKRLLEEEESTEGMYDLAAIYGRIGKYRKEAQVYKAIQSSGATSPELTESIERNTLQLSPRSTLDIDFNEEYGRNGYIDMERWSFGSSFWFTSDLNKDIRLLYAYNNYSSTDSDLTATSNLLSGSFAYEFAKDYELILGIGTEKISGDNDTDLLYKVEFKGQLDDYVNAYALVEKKPIYDTVEAVKEQVTFHTVETGLNMETPIGLAFGGDFRHRSYSDGNSQDKMHAYSSYSMFSESLQLVLRYDYQYLQNADANSSGTVELLGDEFSFSGPSSYWSPSFYSEHRMNLHFQHDFLGYQQGTKRGISYYAVDTAVGLEENENVSYTGVFDIFLEMSPHFLLKGNFILSKSDEFEEKGFSLSLHYRW